ncbi:hypothetical protein IGK74_002284 [Enterococcus sp. AZ150]
MEQKTTHTNLFFKFSAFLLRIIQIIYYVVFYSLMLLINIPRFLFYAIFLFLLSGLGLIFVLYLFSIIF